MDKVSNNVILIVSATVIVLSSYVAYENCLTTFPPVNVKQHRSAFISYYMCSVIIVQQVMGNFLLFAVTIATICLIIGRIIIIFVTRFAKRGLIHAQLQVSLFTIIRQIQQ